MADSSINSASSRVSAGFVALRQSLGSNPGVPNRHSDRIGPTEPAPLQHINIDGREFDLSAPRGTYLNILV